MIEYENDTSGTVLKLEEKDSAIIRVDGEEHFRYLMTSREGHELVPKMDLLMAAFVMKSTDEEWVEEFLTDVFGDAYDPSKYE